MSWYEIRAEGETAEILVYDRIGEGAFEEGVTAKAFLSELRNVTAKAIDLRLNSPGGSVPDGMAIYNALKAHPAKVTTHIDGVAASIASVIALAGDTVQMAGNALFMVHNPHALVAGDATEMRKVADVMDKIRGSMADIYAGRSSLSREELESAMDAETWFTAEEAHSAGFADSITNPIRIAASFDLSQFRNPPTERPVMDETDTITAEAAVPTADTVTSTPIPEFTPEASTTRLDIRPRQAGMPTLTDYILAMGRQDKHVLADYQRRIQAAAPHTLVTDIPGLIPNPIVTPVVDLRDSQAPLFNALGPNAAPEGNSFRIPKITKHLADAAAAAEKSDVTDQLIVGDVDVPLQFIKRAVNISYEAIAYSNPGIVGIAQSDLVDAVLRGCETVVTDGVEAATGTNTAIAVAADGSDAWTVLSAGVAAFYGASGQMPDVFATAPDVWAGLAGMTNQLGSPLVNGVNQTLTGQAGTLFGIPVVISPALTAGKAFILSTYGVKSWASSPVNLQLSQPTTFAYELGGGRNVGVSIADGKFITPVSIAAPLP